MNLTLPVNIQLPTISGFVSTFHALVKSLFHSWRMDLDSPKFHHKITLKRPGVDPIPIHPHPPLTSPMGPLGPGFPQPHPTSAPKIQTLGGCTCRPIQNRWKNHVLQRSRPAIYVENFPVWNGLDMPQS